MSRLSGGGDAGSHFEIDNRRYPEHCRVRRVTAT
jgi:hypothetical protein